MRFFRFCLSALVLTLLAVVSVAQSWTPLTNQPTFLAGNPMLLMDGSVLVHQWETNNWHKLTPDATGSYANGTWSTVAPMSSGYQPLWYGSAVLPDGRLVVDGGEYNISGNAVWTTLGAIYDPAANAWTNVPPPPGWGVVGDAQTVVLPDGRLLLANLTNTQMAVFNPLTNTWSDLPNSGKTDRFDEEGWTLLPDGTVFSVDAINAPNAEKFITSTGAWVNAGTVPVQLEDPSSQELGPQILMPNGKVICFGATGHNAVYVPPATPTDPGTWQAAPDFPIDPTSSQPYDIADGCACLLPNGKVLCEASPGVFGFGVKFFEFDGTNLTAVVGTPNAPGDSSYYCMMLMLPSGQVMLTDLSGDIELYNPTGSPSSSWRPTITTVPANVTSGTSYTISGTQFNGLSGASAYGDDQQNSTNYPIVRITNNASGHVFYCQSLNPSTMAVATGASTVSTHFTAPLTMEDGPSTIQVVANGIASTATPITAHAVFTKSVSCPATATGGGTATGTVTLNVPAPTGGLTVNLASNSAAAVVPATAFVAAGATTGTFAITTVNNTYASIVATITESYASESNHTAPLKVQPNNRSSFVSQSVPTSMISGQSYPVSIQLKNTGGVTWDTAHTYMLYSINPYNNSNFGMSRIPLTSASVAPGATGTFSATVFGPASAGTFNFQWQGYEQSENMIFGQSSTAVAVTVTKLADAARYVSRTGAVTVNAGADFWVQNTMKNVGTNTWLSTAGYSMMTESPSNDPKWTATRAYMAANSSIAPGSQATFAALCTAPITPGSYTMQWQADKNGTAFGDLTPLLTITVTAGPDDAHFVSQTTVPTSIGPSLTFPVTFTMQNLGSATWDATYSLVPIGNNNFGVTGIVSSSVVQNANGTFTATFTAPASAGTYTFRWRMAHSGVKFGEASTNVSVVVSADAATYVSRSGPTTVNAGSDFYAQTTMKNTGTTTWTSAAAYSMLSLNTNWTATRAYMAANSSIAPGSSATFAALCTAPTTPGVYPMQWQCDKNGVAFGDKSPVQSFTVVQGADNATYVTETAVPSSQVHSTTFNVTFTMKNAGTGTWDGTYSLVPIGTNNFGITGITSVSVAPNANGTFTATFTAPATTGSYKFQWRMSHSGVKFGQPTPSVTITVT